jgi:(R,R)-butanediol dehydrogenase/meso-butanediol dehydrogenase/diacetyl reductase
MRAAVFHGKRDLRIEDVPGPGLLDTHEVLVRPLYCGICGTDFHEYTSGPIVTRRDPHPYTGAGLPQILGHEFSAEVVDVGSDVANVSPGDLVSINPLVMPQDDFYSRRGLHNMSPNLATIGLQSRWGGMAEKAVVNDYNVYRMPAGMDPRLGALIEPSAVALYGVESAGVGGGSTAFISGGGPIGALAVLACAALGASKIFVSEPNATRRTQLESLDVGAVVLDPGRDDIGAVVRGTTQDGLGVDAAIECSGVQAGLDACVDAVRNHGTIAQIGIQSKKVLADLHLWSVKGLTFKGINGFPLTEWPRILAMVHRGLYPVGKIITSEVSLRDVVVEGFEKLLRPDHGEMKILVRI